MFRFQDLSFGPHPVHAPSSFLPSLPFPSQLGPYEVCSAYAASASTPLNLASTPTTQGSLLATVLSCPRATLETSHGNQLHLYLVLKILSSLGFYETLLPWLCPTCPPIHSPCSSLEDLKCKLYSCSNLPMTSKSPANLTSLRIVPLSSMLAAPL